MSLLIKNSFLDCMTLGKVERNHMLPPQLAPIPENQTNRPTVSVVIPTWNRSQELAVVVEDMGRQTLQDFELFIIDDQSPDNTEEVGKKLAASDSRFYYHRLPEKGFIYTGMNEGIRRSSGQYIYIAHDHDRYHPELLEKLVAVFDQDASVVYGFTGVEAWDHQFSQMLDTHIHDMLSVTNGQAWRNRLLSSYHCPVPAQSMIRRSALERAGLFNSEFGASTDVEMWIRLCEYGNVGYVKELLLRIRGRDINHHYIYNWEVIDEVARIHRHHQPRISFKWQIMRQYIGFFSQYDQVMLSTYLSAYRRRRMNVVREGRHYLRKNGILFSRLAGYLI